MPDTLPKLPGHPEPHTYTWTKLELEAIERYGAECRRQALEDAAHTLAGIGAGYAGAARRLSGREATHAAGQRDGANECAAAVRSLTYCGCGDQFSEHEPGRCAVCVMVKKDAAMGGQKEASK